MSDTITKPPVDLGLLEGALIHIKEHPEEWDQRFWSRTTMCGTTFCLAGHVAILSGAESPGNVSTGDLWQINPDGSVYVWRRGVTAVDTLHVSEYAAKILGLSVDQAGALFHHERTLEQLDTLVALLRIDPDANLLVYAFRQGWDI